MRTDTRAEYVTRDSVLKLLSDREVASVSNAESAPRLADGEEYLDLTQLAQGVQRAPGSSTPMGHVLPKKAVHKATWKKILAHLATPPSPKNQVGRTS